MPIRIEQAPDGRRRAITDGLAAVNGAECAVELVGSMAEAQAFKLLEYISDYVSAPNHQILAGETMGYGWSTIRFVSSPQPGVLTIGELADPLATGNAGYINGAAIAAQIRAQQDDTIKRNHIAPVDHYPHRLERAVICRLVAPGTVRRTMVFDRLTPAARYHSGWVVTCSVKEHDHNDQKELAFFELLALAQIDPRIVDYVAMPQGSRIVFTRSNVIVFGPGQREPHIDESIQVQ